MYNDRPISEIANIIFHMDDKRVQRAAELRAQGILELSKVEVRKRIREKDFQREMKLIEEGESVNNTPIMDKEHFTLYRK